MVVAFAAFGCLFRKPAILQIQLIHRVRRKIADVRLEQMVVLIIVEDNIWRILHCKVLRFGEECERFRAVGFVDCGIEQRIKFRIVIARRVYRAGPTGGIFLPLSRFKKFSGFG